jgi:hypothetical protein
VTDQQAVPQHAVEYVDQQVEVGVRAQNPVDLASLEQLECASEANLTVGAVAG